VVLVGLLGAVLWLSPSSGTDGREWPDWDGPLAADDLPPAIRAVAVEADVVAEVVDDPVRVLPPDMVIPTDEVEGWSARSWPTVNQGQFGRWLGATGAPEELWGQVLNDVAQPRSMPVAATGYRTDGSEVTGRAELMDDERFGTWWRLDWAIGDSDLLADPAAPWDPGVPLPDGGPVDPGEGSWPAVIDVLTGLLDAARVPHRAWTFTIADPVEGIGWSEVTLHPVVPGEVRPDVGTALRGLPASTVRLVDGPDGPIVVGVDVHVARWVHTGLPTDLGSGWPDTIGSASAAVDRVVRVAGEGDGTVVGEGATGLEALVVVDRADSELVRTTSTIPPALCRDVPAGVLDRLTGTPRHLGGVNLADIEAVIGSMDSCSWAGPDGSVTALLGTTGRVRDTEPVAPEGGVVEAIEGGWAIIYPQPDQRTWTVQLVWDGLDRALVLDITGSAVDVDGLRGVAEDLAGALPPSWHNTMLGDTVREYAAG
jgi:hypothetical protein